MSWLPLSFAMPMVLWGLVALPVIWWLLRLTPPKPQTEIFPPLRILARVLRKEETPHQSPWWLTLLRLLMAALVIFALAGPVYNPREKLPASGAALALVIDNSWFAREELDPGAFDGQEYRVYNVLPDALLVNFQSIEFLFRPDGKQVAVSANPAPTTLRIVNNLKLSRGKCRSQRIAMTVDTPVNGLSTVTFKGNYPVSCGESSMYRAVVPARPMAAGTFLNLWQNQGGTLSGAIRATAVPADARPLYTQPSRPLAELIRGMNKYSNNVMTRQLFLTLGAERFGPPATLAKSRNTITEWLAEQGLQMPELVLDNGAGLSRQTRISARNLGRLLIFASHSEYGPEFLASLPLAGIDGTMRRRFRKEDLLGQARFKTGTLNGVRAIAGYLRSRSDRTFAVVMLHNQTGVQNGTGSRVQDALLRWLYEQ